MRKLNYYGVLNSEVRENKVSPNFEFVFVLQLFKVFRLGKLAEYTHQLQGKKLQWFFLVLLSWGGLQDDVIKYKPP
jgi:hypothetical protein